MVATGRLPKRITVHEMTFTQLLAIRNNFEAVVQAFVKCGYDEISTRQILEEMLHKEKENSRHGN